MRLLLIIFIFFAQFALGQNGKIKLINFKYSECETTLLSNLRTRIVKKEIKADVFKVEVATVATCCRTFQPIVSMKELTLYLDFKETGDECECSCYYTLTYEIIGISDKDVEVKFRGKDIELSDEKYLTYPIKFKILNGDTINFVDKYGFRQGKWTYSNDSTMNSGFFEAKDGVPLKLVTLHPNKKVKSLRSREEIVLKDVYGEDYHTHSNYNYYVEYFESGDKKMECRSFNSSDSYKDRTVSVRSGIKRVNWFTKEFTGNERMTTI